MYDCDGVKLRTISLAAQKTDTFGESPIAGLQWYHPEGGKSSTSTASLGPEAPCTLCVAFDNGLIQLSRGDDDSNAIVLNTDLVITACAWNGKGTVLAITGMQRNAGKDGKSMKEIRNGEEKRAAKGGDDEVGELGSPGGKDTSKQVNMIKFYDAFGRFLRCVKIPGERVASMSWEGSGLRIALAVDSFIFFANIRPAYTWAYLLNTVVYSFT